ncbi:hypothetical protein FTX61_01710 [Nitriliruptoraceae bacterium ZYF776]|nr:hypothetical protein [Profundirhabdus halotolerans]
MTHPVDDLRAFLLGSWTVERTITTLDGHPAGGFTGTASWQPVDGDDARLDHLEVGTAHLGDHVGPAERRLRYRVVGARAEVRFADGRRFHDLDLADGRDVVAHPCRADAYEGAFEVLDADTWTQVWVVRGPAKAHRLATTLRRSSRWDATRR